MLNKLIKIARAIPHMLVTMPRMTLGRWYYFRDRPDWFVEYIAFASRKRADPPVRRYIQEAREELGRRTEQVARSADAKGHPDLGARLRELNAQRAIAFDRIDA